MKRDVVYGKSGMDLWQQGAQKMYEMMAAVPESQPIVLGLCGGRSVGGLLQALVPILEKAPKSLHSRLQLFLLDERVVPLNHSDSNYRLVSQAFLTPLIRGGVIKEAQQHPYEAEPGSAAASCKAYYEELKKFGGRFSVVVLAIGEDGHVAGLFPKHPSLSVSESTFLSFNDSPKPPPSRMTASIPLLQAASGAILMAVGEGKQVAYKRYMDPAVALEECPSKLVDQIDSVCVVTDLKVV